MNELIEPELLGISIEKSIGVGKESLCLAKSAENRSIDNSNPFSEKIFAFLNS